MRRVTKVILISSGSLCVVLGTIGMFVPLLPTTPFLLLGAVCYSRSSERFYRRLLENRVCGKYITNYRESGGITLRQKVTALAMLWISIANTTWFLGPMPWIKFLLIAIASGVTIYLIRLKTIQPGPATRS